MSAAIGRQRGTPSGDVVRERLQWSLEIGDRSHALIILPAWFGATVSIELDGRTAMRLPKPKPQRPWREGALEIDGQPVTVALAWNRPVMRIDVFVAGRSLIDGRPIDEARQTAPRPMSDYEFNIGFCLFRNEIPQPRPLLPPHYALVALAAIAAVIGLSATVPPHLRLGGAAVVGAAGATLAVLWFRSWFVVIERAHVYLLARPELGEVGRHVRFFAAFVGYAVASIAIFVAILFALGS